MSADLGVLLAHLELETAPILGLLAALEPQRFSTPTPAAGWSVLDQVTHLAYFDEVATAAVGGPESFGRFAAEAASLGTAYVDDVAARYRDMDPSGALSWWRSSRAAMAEVVGRSDARARVPWFGAEMSVASLVTARIMETWAHGQDVYDALDEAHPVTDALYDVALLGARTRANSYVARGLVPPADEVAVELRAPDAATWTFGSGPVAIRGEAVEFCLLATQRRHLDDTSLVAVTPAGAEWLGIAQAFAGPPGTGRRAVGAAT